VTGLILFLNVAGEIDVRGMIESSAPSSDDPVVDAQQVIAWGDVMTARGSGNAYHHRRAFHRSYSALMMVTAVLRNLVDQGSLLSVAYAYLNADTHYSWIEHGAAVALQAMAHYDALKRSEDEASKMQLRAAVPAAGHSNRQTVPS
jgi:hypothetical protein